MKNIIKKIIAAVLLVALIVAMTACASKAKASESKETTKEETSLDGGWQAPDSMEITDEIIEMVEKATADMLGVKYEPVAVIGRQIVSGTNYRILCKITPVTPDAAATYAIVTIYETLDGAVEVTDIQNCDAEIVTGGPMGGWQDQAPAVTEESQKALENALENLVGAEYKEICCLRTQIVNGTNYCLLCEITPVVPNAESHFAIVFVYEDLDGNAQITDVFDFLAV